MDFIRGAALGIDGLGKPIIAMSSVTADGESKIVPELKTGYIFHYSILIFLTEFYRIVFFYLESFFHILFVYTGLFSCKATKKLTSLSKKQNLNEDTK